ncbi:hypothetical protein O181_036943 [Austropuccinia psidii MF-1]|uniref:Uncharacterized protein n=1 Tax=Austropuccinia psidii MF-1 TaxID=1389203 RepID=A0A9Q3H9N0_9BASI|nr:hypothetical protein [Austropuccinia psidii MF-1]
MRHSSIKIEPRDCDIQWHSTANCGSVLDHRRRDEWWSLWLPTGTSFLLHLASALLLNTQEACCIHLRLDFFSLSAKSMFLWGLWDLLKLVARRRFLVIMRSCAISNKFIKEPKRSKRFNHSASANSLSVNAHRDQFQAQEFHGGRRGFEEWRIYPDKSAGNPIRSNKSQVSILAQSSQPSTKVSCLKQPSHLLPTHGELLHDDSQLNSSLWSNARCGNLDENQP